MKENTVKTIITIEVIAIIAIILALIITPAFAEAADDTGTYTYSYYVDEENNTMIFEAVYTDPAGYWIQGASYYEFDGIKYSMADGWSVDYEGSYSGGGDMYYVSNLHLTNFATGQEIWPKTSIAPPSEEPEVEEPVVIEETEAVEVVEEPVVEVIEEEEPELAVTEPVYTGKGEEDWQRTQLEMFYSAYEEYGEGISDEEIKDYLEKDGLDFNEFVKLREEKTANKVPVKAFIITGFAAVALASLIIMLVLVRKKNKKKEPEVKDNKDNYDYF